MSREHVVKCWLNYFDAIESGEKKFDVRRDDRGYQKGDTLVLKKWDPEQTAYIAEPDFGFETTVDADYAVTVSKRVRYILTGGQFGIEPGYVVLGF